MRRQERGAYVFAHAAVRLHLDPGLPDPFDVADLADGRVGADERTERAEARPD